MKKIRIADVIAMAALVVVILVTLIIAANLQNIANDMDLGAAGNESRTTLFANTFTGLTLASIGIIVTAAVGLIAVVLSTLGRATGGVS